MPGRICQSQSRWACGLVVMLLASCTLTMNSVIAEEPVETIALVDETMSRWKTTGNWQIKSGVISLDEPVNRKWSIFPNLKAFLWSDTAYDDFEIDFEFKLPPKGRSGLFVRSSSLSKYLEVQISDTPPDSKLVDDSCGGLVDCQPPSQHAVKPAGQWNQMVIRMVGNQVNVTLNDQKVLKADLADYEKESIRKGRLAFQDQGYTIDLRNINIRPIDSSP